MLLLDEPLGALDLKLRQQLQVELKRIQPEVGITFIYVTHDQDEALTMSDRIAVMDRGRVLQMGAPNEVYDEPGSEFVAGFVGVSNLLELEVESVANGVAPSCGSAEDDEIRAAARQSAREQRSWSRSGPSGSRSARTLRGRRRGHGLPRAGTVRESLYAGPTTRFVVELDGGGELMVVRQNARTSLEDAEALQGRPVKLVWAAGIHACDRHNRGEDSG